MIIKFYEFITENQSQPTDIAPVGQGGNRKGEKEMLRIGLEYIKELRLKFEESDEIPFTELKLVKLTKELGLNYNFARFINKHEMNVKNRIHSLKHPEIEPTLDYVRNIYKEYRKYDTNIQLNRFRRFTPEERLNINREGYQKKNERRRQVWRLNKLLGIPNTQKEKRISNTIIEIEKTTKDPTFINFCRRLSPNNYQDIIQDTLEVALRQKDTYIPKAKMITWLIRIAKNITLAKFKKIRRSKEDLTPDFYDSDLVNVYENPIDLDDQEEQNIEVILKCFNELPEHQKDILNLSMDGLSSEEIAEELNNKQGTNYSADYVKTKIYNVRKKLANDIHKILPDLVIKGTSGAIL